MNVQKLFDLSGKVALITGGFRGLGLQIAEGARDPLAARQARLYGKLNLVRNRVSNKVVPPRRVCLAFPQTGDKSLTSHARARTGA